MMRLIVLDDIWAAAFNRFVSAHPTYLIYYSWSYRRLLVHLLDCEPVYLGVIDELGELQGVLPLMVSHGSYGRVYNSLPFFGSYGGVVAANEAAEAILWKAYQDLVNEAGVAASTLIMNPLNERTPPHFDLQDFRIGQFTDLTKAPLLPLFDASTRRNIKKALNSGVVVSVENNALDHLESIHRENMEAIGGRSKPKEFFTCLPELFKPDSDYKLWVARKEGEVVSVLLLFYAGNVVEYFIPGTRLAHRNSQPSAAIIYEAMQDAVQRGYSLWNWGGTWKTQEGVLRFKRKWGAEERIYHYYTTIANKDLVTANPVNLAAAYPNFFVLPFDQIARLPVKQQSEDL